MQQSNKATKQSFVLGYLEKDFKLYTLLFFCFLISCQEQESVILEPDNNECSCATKPEKVIEVSLNDIYGEIQIWSPSENYSQPVDFSYARASGKLQSQFLDILDGFDLLEQIDYKSDELIRAILYFEGDLNESDALGNGRLVGALIYHSDGNALKTKVFSYNDGTFEEFKDLKSRPKWMSINDFQTCAKVFDSGVKVTGVDIFNPGSFDKYKFTYPVGDSYDFDQKLQEKLNPEGVVLRIPDGPNCVHPCQRAPGRCIPQEKTGNIVVYRCMGGCLYEESHLIIEDYSSTEYSVNHASLYSFKDSFLTNTTLGEEYINHFYVISNFISSEMSLQTALDIMDITKDEVMPRIQSMMSNPNSSDTLFDAEAKIIGQAFLSELESLSDDSLYLNTINTISSDLDLYVNRTIEDLTNELEGD